MGGDGLYQLSPLKRSCLTKCQTPLSFILTSWHDAYAGERILLRFEYVTDDSLNGPGWAIDDIAVPEIGFFDDAEGGEGGWEREGFLHLSEPLRQHFELRLVTLGATTEVSEIPLDGQNQAEVALTGLGTEYQHAVVVIVGVTEGTTEPARYRYEATSVG